MTRPTLDDLALTHGTDKSSKYHGYTAIYETLLEPIRDEPITLLELGVGGHHDPAAGGASLRMWRDYLPHATIVGLDIAPKPFLAIPGVDIIEGSQSDPQVIATLGERYRGFDVVIDDASHVSSLTIASWQLLYPWLHPSALYAVEDTHGAYHAHYYGDDQAHPDPDGHTSTGQPTTMQYLRRLADEVNHIGGDVLYPSRYALGYQLEWICFWFNLAAIRRRA